MPALPSVNKVLKVQYKFAIGGDLGAMCHEFWAYTGTGPSVADADTFAGDISNSYNTWMCPFMTDEKSLEEVIVTDLTSPTAAVGTDATAHVGSLAGNYLPASASALLSRTVARRYRGGHPRTYLPLGNQANLDGSQTWDAGIIADWLSAWGSHVDQVETGPPATIGTVTPVNVSYYAGFTPHEGTTGRYRNVASARAIPVVDAIEGFLFRLGVAQIRRRLLGLA
jgi:hypothetical protein